MMATALMTPESAEMNAVLWLELWTSLASVLRSYTAAHGLNQKEQATVELGPNRIVVRAGSRWLQLDRNLDEINWSRDNANGGQMRFTIEGLLRIEATGHEEEMDLQAEAWARELMQ